MKVVYVTHVSGIFDGSGKALCNMLYGLMEKGIEPLVVFPQSDGLCQVFREKGIKTQVLNYRIGTYPPVRTMRDVCLFLPRLAGRILLNRRASCRLAAIAQQWGAELIHSNTSVVNIGYRAARRLGLPHVWHIREYGALNFYYHYYYYTRKAFLQKLRAKMSYTICITKDVQQYDRLDGWEASRVIYDGVLSERQLRLHEQKEPYFLFAGRLEENKGIGDLLPAFSDFVKHRPGSKITLKVAGDTVNTAYRDFLRSEAHRLGVADRVEFLGMRKDVLELMSKAYAMIVPSRSEGFGFITAEAMFSGALVIGRNTTGTKEQFDNGVQQTGNEIALRYDTQEELVRCMCEVVDNGIEHYFPMIRRSQQVVRKLYSSENHTKQVYDFYKQIISV